ncbi:sugar transporter domain-containing protein [Sarocladium implicatum]|nr:sugar transporter domain-containing protein [Sarocladium implicatum]
MAPVDSDTATAVPVPVQDQQHPMQNEKPTGGAPGSGAVHVENEHASIETLLADDVLLAQYAEEAANGEAALSVWESIKLYYPALGWALLCATCVIMEGYDTILIGNFFAFPAFADKYGTLVDARGNSQLTAAWQSGLNNSHGVGAFFGVLLNGYLVGKLGQKRTLIYALAALSAFIFIVFFAPNTIALLCGWFLCGLPWGVFATSAPAYASEVLPLRLRIYLTSYTNMCFIIGQLIAAGVLAGLIDFRNEWGYRIPMALQWVWPVFLIPVCFFMPESPWHLVRKGRYSEAEAVVGRLISKKTQDSDRHKSIDTRKALALIVHTNKTEEQLSIGTSYWDCFKGPELRRTEIACVCFAGQVLSGSQFAYNSTYFFQQVGIPSKTAYNLNVGGTGMALFAALMQWFCLAPYVGRRTNYLGGMLAMAVILYIIGFLQIRGDSDSFGMTQAVLTLIWTFVFQLSAGQLGWALPAEVSSSRLRQKTICMARNAYYIAIVVANAIQPYAMNPFEWNLSGYTGFIWGSTSLLVFLWAFFRLPETKDRAFEELDIMFAKGLPARQFSKYEPEAFVEAHGGDITAKVEA